VDRLLSESDFLTVHLPLTKETRGILNGAAFQKMKPTAFVINTSRGEVIAEADLARALKEGRLAGAALDVREKEPPEKESPPPRNGQCDPHPPYRRGSRMKRRRRSWRPWPRMWTACSAGLPRCGL